MASSSSNTDKFRKKLVCVNYPGVVEDTEKMFKTLGGKHNIEMAVCFPTNRLELRFRPDNFHCKPAIADKDMRPGILIKVKVPKNRNESEKDNNHNGGLDYEVVGVTVMNFNFNRPCDFQYLPLVTKDKKETRDSEVEYIYNKIIPDELPDKAWLMSEESKNMPLFLPPPVFTRNPSNEQKVYFDRVLYYENPFGLKFNEGIKEHLKIRKTQIEKQPKRLKTWRKAFYIKDEEVPDKPYEMSFKALKRYSILKEYEQIKALFEERPIWSKTAIQYKLGLNLITIKHLLSTVAYYCIDGPWRIMWIRYGYDPRKNPESRIYQTFDFRIRTSEGLKAKVKSKRSNFAKPQVQQKVSLQNDLSKLNIKNTLTEEHFILRPGILPPARQMIYQYCDVHIPEIEAMLSKLPPILPTTRCDEKNGWLPSSFTDQCREIVNRYIIKSVKAQFQEEKEYEIREKNEEVTTDVEEFELLEISDTDEEDFEDDYKRQSDSEDEVEVLSEESEDMQENEDVEFENEVDLEAVEDINKILGVGD